MKLTPWKQENHNPPEICDISWSHKRLMLSPEPRDYQSTPYPLINKKKGSEGGGSWKGQVKSLHKLRIIIQLCPSPLISSKTSFSQGSADFRSHSFISWAWKKIKKKTDGLMYLVEYYPPPHHLVHVHWEPANATLFGTRALADVIRWGHPDWGWALNSETHTEGRKPCEQR